MKHEHCPLTTHTPTPICFHRNPFQVQHGSITFWQIRFELPVCVHEHGVFTSVFINFIKSMHSIHWHRAAYFIIDFLHSFLDKLILLMLAQQNKCVYTNWSLWLLWLLLNKYEIIRSIFAYGCGYVYMQSTNTHTRARRKTHTIRLFLRWAPGCFGSIAMNLRQIITNCSSTRERIRFFLQGFLSKKQNTLKYL